MPPRTPAVTDTVDPGAWLGRRIRAVRAARAMTMKQLAQQSGISLPYLSRVEKGEGNISIAVLYKLAGALNMSPDTLLTDNLRYGPDYALIVEMLKRQPPERLSKIRQWLVEHVADEGGHRPRRIALIGLRGAGKSTLGSLLARKLSLPFVELDKQIEQEAGVALDLIFSIYGQAGYRRLERLCLDRILADYHDVVLATGGGIVVEPATYELLLHSFHTVWLQAEPEEHFRRVMAQHDARIATPQLRDEAMANIEDALNARRKLYSLAHHHLETTGQPIDVLLDRLVQLIQAQQSFTAEPASAA